MFDGDGQPVPDCMLEIWQADAQGRFADPQDKRALPNSAFRGFGRCGTDPNGDYAFDTIKPGQVPDPDGKPQAPHLLLAIFARGMLLHNYTRIYFDGEAANAADPVLALVPADRRATLIATRKPGNGAPSTASTSTCRATTRRCFSIFDGLRRRELLAESLSPPSSPGLTGRSSKHRRQRLLDHPVQPGDDDFLLTRSPHGPAPPTDCAMRPWWIRS